MDFQKSIDRHITGSHFVDHGLQAFKCPKCNHMWSASTYEEYGMLNFRNDEHSCCSKCYAATQEVVEGEYVTEEEGMKLLKKGDRVIVVNQIATEDDYEIEHSHGWKICQVKKDHFIIEMTRTDTAEFFGAQATIFRHNKKTWLIPAIP